MKVKRIGNTSATTINIGDWQVLFSYSTPVAAYENGVGFYRTSKKWSTTTTKHINRFLDGAKAEEKSQEWFDNLTDFVSKSWG